MGTVQAPLTRLFPTVLGWGLSTVAALVVAHFASFSLCELVDPPWLWGWRRELLLRFQLDQEIGVATWASTLLLAASSGVLVLLAREASRSGQADRRHWLGLAAGAGLLSLDEAACFHEIAVEPVARNLAIEHPALRLAWVLPGGAISLLVVAVSLRFWSRLPHPARWRLGWAVALYLSGALGMEAVGSAWAATHGSIGLGLTTIQALEESFEMAGASVLLAALLQLADDRRAWG